jgi:hypothetical protein
MLSLYKFLLYWSLFGYLEIVLFYIWDKYFNVKLSDAVYRLKVVKYSLKNWHYALIILSCGPAVVLTVIILLLIDGFRGNWTE